MQLHHPHSDSAQQNPFVINAFCRNTSVFLFVFLLLLFFVLFLYERDEW